MDYESLHWRPLWIPDCLNIIGMLYDIDTACYICYAEQPVHCFCCTPGDGHLFSYLCPHFLA